PGERRRDLIETVQRQAQLRFRLVACSEFTPCNTAGAPTGTPLPDAPQAPETNGQGGQGDGQGGQGDGQGDGQGRDANRAPVDYGEAAAEPTADPDTPDSDGPGSEAPDADQSDAGQSDAGQPGE